MFRKIFPAFAFFLLASLSAQAQDDKVEVFGGYSYLHFHNSPSVSLNGWEASAQYKFTDWLGGVADFDGHYGSLHGAGTSTYTYLFGPQLSYPARVSPFGHLLLGGAHLGVGGFGSSSFAMALGGPTNQNAPSKTAATNANAASTASMFRFNVRPTSLSLVLVMVKI